MKRLLIRLGLPGAAFLLAVAPPRVMACAACFGRSDSKLAEGMNMGIFTLLVVVLCVLGGFAAFFAYLARRSARAASGNATESLNSTTRNSLP